MQTPEQTIHTFYTAFQKRDFAQMQTCYAKDATFEDPAFGPLTEKQVKAMWHMLCSRALDLVITYEILDVNADQITAKWIAEYTYSTYETHVRNEITATFTFQDGKIKTHKDQFNFWKWSKQALGFTGVYLGWTSLLKRTVRKSVLAALAKFISKHPEYS